MNPTETLLSINEAIANTSDSEQLFLSLYHHLNQLYPFELSGIFLFDTSREKCSIYWIGKQGAKPNLQCRVIKVGIQDLQDEPFRFQFNNPNIRIIKPQTLNFPIEMRNIKILFEQHAITETIHIPMMHRGILIGYIVLGFQSSQNMTANDAHFLIQIGNLIAAAVLNTRHFEEMERRNKITQFQVEFTNNMLRVINDPDIFLHLAKELNNRLNFDFFNIMVLSEHLEANIEATFVKTSNGSFRFVDLPDGFKIQPLHSQKLFIDGNPHITRLNRKELLEFVDSNTTLDEKIDIKILSMIYVVLKSESSCKIILDLGSTNEDAFTEEETDLLEHILPQLKLLLENYFLFEQSRQLKMHLENERNSLLKDWRHELNVDGFVAESRQMMQVLFRVKQVAPTDTTVLIEGETGVGKELIAKAIHFNSPRSSGPVVMVNCTTLPPNLIESELFGHEKGSFTGATERRIGKFELANGGTLFLDEIGELPIDLQSKLLRVIQEKE
ncbi:MAG: DNA-binding protein Fis / transcriptional regulator, Fis family, partial [Bacteroidetes bacterium 38_7]